MTRETESYRCLDREARDIYDLAKAIAAANHDIFLRDIYVLAAVYRLNPAAAIGSTAAEGVIVDWAQLSQLSRPIDSGPICYLACMRADPHLQQAQASLSGNGASTSASQIVRAVIRWPSPTLSKCIIPIPKD